MIEIACYEPAGRVLRLSPEDLTRHVLALGATGSGKTTALINPILSQSIAWRSEDSQRKVGLLILDPKDDGTPEKVTSYARKVGRLNDVRILSTKGTTHYGFFTDFRRLDQVDEFSHRILFGSRDLGDGNSYWSETRIGMINSALTVLLCSESHPSFARVADFLRLWFFESEGETVKSSLAFVARLLTVAALKPSTRRRLQLSLADAANWRAMDSRTRELHKSTFNNALRVLLSPLAGNIFDESNGARFNPADVLSGRLLVASLNGTSHPGLVSLVFKSLKRDFYRAVLARRSFDLKRDRLCGLVLDELPLSVIPEDVEALALLRSMGGFVVGGSQGISSLDEAVGYRKRAALLANFNSVVFFASREDPTDEHALLTLGRHGQPEGSLSNSIGDLQVVDNPSNHHSHPVCPLGTLARLPAHHVFAKLADGSVTPKPLWLAPLFHDYTPVPLPAEPDDLREAVNILDERERKSAKAADSAFFLIYMHRQKHFLKLTPDVLTAAWQLCRPKTPPSRILSKISAQIQGLETLPPCWLVGLQRWLRRNHQLSGLIAHVAIEKGVLWVELDGAAEKWGEGPMSIPEAINLFIYPSLWRPLRPNDHKRLLVDRPDLRAELMSLPQVEDKNF